MSNTQDTKTEETALFRCELKLQKEIGSSGKGDVGEMRVKSKYTNFQRKGGKRIKRKLYHGHRGENTF